MGKLRYRNLVPAEGMSNMFVNIRLATSPQAVKRIAAHVGKELRRVNQSRMRAQKAPDGSVWTRDAPRDKCTLSCAINGIHAAFHYLKKNYISGCVMTVPTG
ncbi:TPA: phage virion morphogenesis protein [Escherichia coli]